MTVPIVHVCTGTNRRYWGQVRGCGCRKWITAGPGRKSLKAAADDMYRRFVSDNYKRGRVIFTTDCYDPVEVMKISKND